MSCCPKAPKITVGGWTGDGDGIGPSVEMGHGESVECYMERVENATDRLDDKTEPVPDKIENNDIPLVGGTDVNVRFRLTVNSQQTPDSWSYACDPPLPDGVAFRSEGTLQGSFPKESYGESFRLTVTAEPSIDSRSYVFAPAKATGSNEISFIHPLPGSTVSSGYGNRVAPKAGASTKHPGVDFAKGGGAAVLAAADGTVIFADPKGKAGNVVVIRHLNAAGAELCTTLYMHLAKFLVTRGQPVVQGQKIGIEGTTGNSTGVHLHFEVRLPDLRAIDPLPLIRGTMAVARRADGPDAPDESTVEMQTNNGVLTPENVEAKQGGCPPGGPSYPKPKGLTNDPIPPDAPDGDAFEKAWFFTMTEEVGPWWTPAYPDDPEVIAGLHATAAQRKKVGLKDFPKNGGVTKFGIAENYNKDLKPVAEITYETAKNRGFQGYWKGRPEKAAKAGKEKLAVMLFDMTFLHGAGSVNKIVRDAGIDGLDEDAAIEALAAAQLRFMYNINGNEEFGGWPKRSAKLLRYAKGIS